MHPVYFDNVAIPFDPTWKNIAISVSGGADSALLAYFVCNLAKESNATIHIINHVRCWKTKPWQEYDAEKVFKWLRWKFYHVNFERHINFIAPELEYGNIGPSLIDEYGKHVSGDNIEIRAFAEYICSTEKCEAYYNAVTRNPRSVDLGGMSERDIEKSSENTHLEVMQHMNGWALHPFRFVEKSWVVQQYRNYNIMDLFDLTRSCEGVFADLDYTNYNPGQEVPVCGECFWCKEREWAIEHSK